jgi:phage gp29-like protein
VKDWVSFCEVFAMPLRIGKYAQGASEADKQALLRAMIQMASDMAGIIPDGCSIEFIESSKTSSINVYEALARYCDEQMSKAILGQTLTSDSGGGSYAQSKTHNEVRHDLTEGDCKSLAATIRRDLLRPLVMYNYGDTARVPYLRFDCEEAEDLIQTAQIYRLLTCDLGLPLSREFLYKKFSLPVPGPEDELAAPRSASPGGGGALLANKAPSQSLSKWGEVISTNEIFSSRLRYNHKNPRPSVFRGERGGYGRINSYARGSGVR